MDTSHHSPKQSFAQKYPGLVDTWISLDCYIELTKGWLAIAKLKPLSLFISLLIMPKKAFNNFKIEK